MANWDCAGHDRAVALLSESIASTRVAHAYLIAGPRQVGKTTLALDFARSLNCQAPQPPCGECRTCRMIAKGIHPDVRILSLSTTLQEEAGSRTSAQAAADRKRRGRIKNIPMEDVRAMLRDVSLAPYEARWKVYVLRYAEDLSLEAVQTLLKTLEEPPAHVVLTLTSVDAKILPLTVVSRCQQVELGLVTPAEIERLLSERYGAEPAQARLLGRLCGGRPGWAVDALNNPDILGKRTERLNALAKLPMADRVERIAFAERLAVEFGRDSEAAVGALELWLGWWRDVLLVKANAVERVVNDDQRQELAAIAERLHFDQLVSVMQSIRRTLRLLQQNVNPRLALECLSLDVPRMR